MRSYVDSITTSECGSRSFYLYRDTRADQPSPGLASASGNREECISEYANDRPILLFILHDRR